MDEELRERLIRSRAAFTGEFIAVTVDEVELPDGRAATREIVHHPGAVAVVPLLDDGRVVMIRQYRQGAGKVLWELPAGVLAAGEQPEACARRELAEEIGQAAGELVHLLSTYTSPGFSTELIHIFLARELQAVEASSESDENIRAVPMALSEAVEMVRRGEVQNAAAVCGLLAAAAWLRPTERQEVAPGS